MPKDKTNPIPTSKVRIREIAKQFYDRTRETFENLLFFGKP